MRRNTGENFERTANQPQGRQPQGQFPPQSNVQQGPPQQGPPPQQEWRGQQGGRQGFSQQSPPPQGMQQQGQPQQPAGQQQQTQPPIGYGAPPQQPPPSGGAGAQPSMAQQSQTQQIGQQAGVAGQQMQQPETMGPKPIPITDVIQTEVVTAELDTTIPDLASRMESEDVGALVIEDDGNPVGVVTDRKIALFCQQMQDPREHTAEDVLSGKLISGTTEMTVFDILEEMSENSIRRLPILDENGELEGIVTLDDLLVLLGTEMQKATDIIQSQSSRL